MSSFSIGSHLLQVTKARIWTQVQLKHGFYKTEFDFLKQKFVSGCRKMPLAHCYESILIAPSFAEDKGLLGTAHLSKLRSSFHILGAKEWREGRWPILASTVGRSALMPIKIHSIGNFQKRKQLKKDNGLLQFTSLDAQNPHIPSFLYLIFLPSPSSQKREEGKNRNKEQG